MGATAKAATPTTATEEESDDGTADAAPASPEHQSVPQVWADFEERVSSLRPDNQNPLTGAMLEVKGFLSEQLIPHI